MEERRAESRILCADMVPIRWTDPQGHRQQATALLEDISPHGACLQLDTALPLHTELILEHGNVRLEGAVRYCVYRDIGYFIGVQFTADNEWSRTKFTPQHLLDLEELVLRYAQRTSRVV